MIAGKTPRAFVCSTSSHCSTVSSCSGPVMVIPALLTATSGRLVLARPDTESRLQGVVVGVGVGSVLGDALLGALRRLAQENVANRMLDG